MISAIGAIGGVGSLGGMTPFAGYGLNSAVGAAISTGNLSPARTGLVQTSTAPPMPSTLVDISSAGNFALAQAVAKDSATTDAEAAIAIRALSAKATGAMEPGDSGARAGNNTIAGVGLPGGGATEVFKPDQVVASLVLALLSQYRNNKPALESLLMQAMVI